MALKDTVNHMKKLLDDICSNLHKADGGNKAAAQRVRTSSIKFAKLSKTYRKESVTAEKGTKKTLKKKPAAKKQMKRATAKIPSKRKR